MENSMIFMLFKQPKERESITRKVRESFRGVIENIRMLLMLHAYTLDSDYALCMFSIIIALSLFPFFLSLSPLADVSMSHIVVGAADEEEEVAGSRRETIFASFLHSFSFEMMFHTSFAFFDFFVVCDDGGSGRGEGGRRMMTTTRLDVNGGLLGGGSGWFELVGKRLRKDEREL